MSDFSIIYGLAGVTLLFPVVIGLWQIRRTHEAKRPHEHSALTDVKNTRH